MSDEPRFIYQPRFLYVRWSVFRFSSTRDEEGKRGATLSLNIPSQFCEKNIGNTDTSNNNPIDMSVQAADPYVVLELRRDANEEQIQRAYRKLSMRWHPDRNQGSAKAAERFSNINEAYDVLTTRSLRALLDKQGLVALGQQYTFTKNPQVMFESFFGTNNPFSVIQEETKKSATLASAGPPPQMINLNCTLNDLFNGCIKRPSVERLIVSNDGLEQKTETLNVDVLIKPGYQSGTSITFNKMGDVLPGLGPSNLTFIINEVPHELYQRVGDDLLYTANITLAQSLGRCELSIVHLDGRSLNIDCNKVIEPNSKMVIKGEGFPSTENKKRGDLILNFNVIFPKHLTAEEQNSLGSILSKKFKK
jgi:DnaJ-class molecular chaperone